MIEIHVDDRQVLEALEDLRRRAADLAPAMRAIAGVLADATERAFQEERDPATGRAWAPHSEVTVLQRLRRAGKGRLTGKRGSALAAVMRALTSGRAERILQDSGQLAASVQSEHGRDYARVGTNKVYATTQQFGAKMGEFGRYSQIARYRKFGEKDFRRYAGTKKGFPIPWGDIPARPFLGLGADDRREVLDILGRYLADAP
jgi:phage gpG-like protein